jgi:hypothetical protein
VVRPALAPAAVPDGRGSRIYPGEYVTQWYIDNYLRATLHSMTLTEIFYQVQNMMVAPTKLFRPDVMLRVIATRLMHRN